MPFTPEQHRMRPAQSARQRIKVENAIIRSQWLTGDDLQYLAGLLLSRIEDAA